MEDDKAQCLRFAKLFASSITKMIRYSLNDEFRSENFQELGVSNTDDFQEACEEQTLRDMSFNRKISSKRQFSSQSPIVEPKERKRKITLLKDGHESSSVPLHDTELEDENCQSEIELIELDSSDDEGIPADYQLANSRQLLQTAAMSQSSTSMSQQSTCYKSSQQSTSRYSQQSTPPLLSQLF